MKSDYGLQFINNIFLLKSSLYTRRECQREREGEYEDVKGMRRKEKLKKEQTRDMWRDKSGGSCKSCVCDNE